MYKGAEFIGETIESVLRQTYAGWEMIIVDDCSPDDGQGVDVVQDYIARDSRIRLIALPVNKGSSGARNEGIRLARGDYIAFLDSDDLWTAEFLEKQLAFMAAMKASIVFSSYRRIAAKTHEDILPPFIVPSRVDYRNILRSLPIFPSTAVINVRETGKHYFDENMGSVRDDYVFWLRLLKEHVNYAYGNKEVLVSYRIRNDSVTANKLKVIRPHWQVLRYVEKLSFIKSCYYLCWWIYISLGKYSK
jgi:teichuronic acid biosynthesis glycosyltransferase TuaG